MALVAQPVPERGGEGRRIGGRDQLTREGAVGGGAERFGRPADGGRDDGQAVGERFGDGHAVGLGARRRDQQVGGGVRLAERRAGQDAAEPDAMAVAETGDPGPQVFDEIRVAVERSDQHAVPVAVAGGGGGGPGRGRAGRAPRSAPGRPTYARQAGIAYRVRTCRWVHSLVTTTAAAA